MKRNTLFWLWKRLKIEPRFQEKKESTSDKKSIGGRPAEHAPGHEGNRNPMKEVVAPRLKPHEGVAYHPDYASLKTKKNSISSDAFRNAISADNRTIFVKTGGKKEKES